MLGITRERRPTVSQLRPTVSLGSLAVLKPDLLTVEAVKNLSVEMIARYFREHLNPGLFHFMEVLGFHNVIVERATGVHYIDRDGRRILDFFGGFGSLALGHNHPRILAARKRFEEEYRHDICMAFMSQYAAALAHNLAQVSPGDLEMVFLGSTGSEVVEAAIKLAEQAQGPGRTKVIYAEKAFHGKTKGALSLTDSPLYRSSFALPDNAVRVPFGNLASLEAAVEADPHIGVIVLETIQGGGGIVEAPAEFWRGLRNLCDRKRILWVADEVQCGVGRTGRFYAFEHFDVIPDIVTVAKSLGGGKCPMAAMITSRQIYMRAYGKPRTALIHGPSTFSGIGEGCITAIEALNVLYDEALLENAATQGSYLIERLEDLRTKYPTLIKDVRGRGLMVGLEFCDLSNALPYGLRRAVSFLDEKFKGSLCCFVGHLLLKEFGILVAFTEYNRNVIRLEPPLIIGRGHIDALAEALDSVLSRGVPRIIAEFARSYALGRRPRWPSGGSNGRTGGHLTSVRHE